MKRRIRTAAIMLSTVLMLSGCGSGQPEIVSDYGGQSTSAAKNTGAEEAGSTSEMNSEKEATEKDTGESLPAEPRNGRSLSEQLGGTELNYEADFPIGDKLGRMDIHQKVGEDSISTTEDASGKVIYSVQIPETEVLPSYRVHEITEDRIYEEEIVKDILGDTAVKVDRLVSEENGDSELVVSCTMDNYYRYNGSDGDQTDPQTGFASWTDEQEYFQHTYEGQYKGMDVQLTIGYRKEMKQKFIAMGPKRWGDVSGNPESKYVTNVSDINVDRPRDTKVSWRGAELTELLGDPTNKTSANLSTLTKESRDFTKNILRLKMPEDSVGIAGTRAGGDLTGAIQMLFMSNSREDLYEPEGKEFVLNGYVAGIEDSDSLGGQPVYMNSYSGEGEYRGNSGQFYITDQGVVGFFAYICFDFEEQLSDQVAILPFEKAMDAFRENVAREFDTSKATGNDITFKDALLAYYLMESPEKNGEYTYIPVWVLEVYSNGTYNFGAVIQNAMDGSLIGFDLVK